MHENNFMMFEEFLITESGKVQCIGGLIEENTQFSEKVSEDYHALAVYLIETLYGKSFDFTSIK